jgi:hypothetical protein
MPDPGFQLLLHVFQSEQSILARTELLMILSTFVKKGLESSSAREIPG